MPTLGAAPTNMHVPIVTGADLRGRSPAWWSVGGRTHVQV